MSRRVTTIVGAIALLIGSVAHGAEDAGGYVAPYDAKRKNVVVFIHGVLGDDRSTWTNANGTYWPDLVRRDPAFKSANVYVHRFESTKIETAQDIEELARRLGEYLERDDVIKVHDRLFFVSHSMGGLVTRALLVQRRLPAKKVPMIYFFGTPSAGANAAGIASAASKNKQFQNMLPFARGTYVEQLAKKWLDTSKDAQTGYPRKIWSFCAYEKKPYYGQMIVEELSAIYLCNMTPSSVMENHVDMVKPAGPRAEAHVYLANAYTFVSNPKTENLMAALDGSTIVSMEAGVWSNPLFAGKVLKFRTAVLSAGSGEVGCAQDMYGERLVIPKLANGEMLVGSFADVVATKNLKTYAVHATPNDSNQIVLKYAISGRDQGSDCQSFGSAGFSVKYLVAEPPEK